MTDILLYREDGTAQPSTTTDPAMVSTNYANRALETWQVGHVNQQLAISAKTTGAISRLFSEIAHGTTIEVVYRLKTRVSQVRELFTFSKTKGPESIVLIPQADWKLSDAELVRRLDAFWGEYIAVTFSPLSDDFARLPEAQDEGPKQLTNHAWPSRQDREHQLAGYYLG